MKKANTDQHKGYWPHWISSAPIFLHVPEKTIDMENKKEGACLHLTCSTCFLSEADVWLYLSLPLHLIWIWHEDRNVSVNLPCFKMTCQENEFQLLRPALPSLTLQATQRSWLTWVVWQVREANRLALHLVWEATKGDTDFNLLCDVLVLVRGSLKDDGDLPVHVCLGKLPARLPRPSFEDDLYVICGSVTTYTATLISRSEGLFFYNLKCPIGLILIQC